MKQATYEDGFTLVEIIVTLFIAVVFLGVILQTVRISNSQHVTATSQMTAANIAQSNLHKFPTHNAAVQAGEQFASENGITIPSGSAPFFCRPGTVAGGAPAGWTDFYDSTPNTNLASNPDAEGATILNDTSAAREQDEATLAPLVNPMQRVAVFAPNGCRDGGHTIDSPNADVLKIQSTVEYGPPDNRQTVEFSNYVKE